MNKGIGFALAALAALTTSLPAQAQELCIPQPMSLPWLSGPPTWFDPGASSTSEWRPQIDDPRWASAQLIHLCNDTDLTQCPAGTDQAHFRVLIQGTNLYLSVSNLIDDSFGSTDSVMIALADNSNNSAKAARIRLRTSPAVSAPAIWAAPLPVPTHVEGAGTSDAVIWEAADALGADAADWTVTKGLDDAVLATDWLKDVASWGSSGTTRWSMTMRIDLTQFGYAAPVTADIKLFVGTRYTPTAGTAILIPNVATVTERVGGTQTSIPADEALWTTFKPPAGCTAGITITSGNIGVADGGTNVSSTINACAPGNTTAPCPGATNTFRIKPQGASAIASTGHGIRARIRLANWGSTIDHANAPFTDIDGSTTAPTIPAATCPSSGWCWNSTGPVIEYQCSVTGTNLFCPVLSNASATNFHHCMLVQLDSAPGANLIFRTAAAYRNMNFVGLSTHSAEATISIEGLKQVTGVAQDRDVYLYVQRSNMPPGQSKGMTLPKEAMQAVRNYAQAPPPPLLFDERDPEAKRRLAELAQRFRKFSPASLADPAKAVSNPPESNPLTLPTLSDEQAMRLVWPTYKVFPYYDTGEKTDVEGQQVPILAHMVPFGLYLDHDGEFFGFADSLVGAAGAVLDAIPNAPNWFKVRIPSEGSIKVTVTVEALDQPPVFCPDGSKAPCPCADGHRPPPPCEAPPIKPCADGSNPPCDPPFHWWILILALLALGLLVWLGYINRKK